MKCAACWAATAIAERLRVREADVLGREDDQPPRDEEWILPRLEHPREPVDRGVRVAAAHGLDECGDQPVVLIACTVVQQRRVLECALDVRHRHAHHSRGIRHRRLDREFQ